MNQADIHSETSQSCSGGSRIFERGVQVQADYGNSTDCFIMAGNERCAGQEDCFLNLFVHRRTAVADSEPTKTFSKRSPETAMLHLSQSG